MTAGTDPTEILKQRFARGEIDADAFKSSMDMLATASPNVETSVPDSEPDAAPDHPDYTFRKALHQAGYMFDEKGEKVAQLSKDGQDIGKSLWGVRLTHFSWSAAISYTLFGGVMLLVAAIVILSVGVGLVAGIFSLDLDALLGTTAYWILYRLIWVIVFAWAAFRVIHLKDEYERFAAVRDRVRRELGQL